MGRPAIQVRRANVARMECRECQVRRASRVCRDRLVCLVHKECTESRVNRADLDLRDIQAEMD